nr:nuclear transport factor 2 family protein [Crateriforma spongiae]
MNHETTCTTDSCTTDSCTTDSCTTDSCTTDSCTTDSCTTDSCTTDSCATDSCATAAVLPTDIRPPFDRKSALAKVQAAEDAWNSRDPHRVARAYSVDSQWRNRDQFFVGREAITEFLTDKWQRELDYRLEKELWSFTENRISVRFEYEWHDATGQWFRTHGNEHWEFDDDGLMQRRDMSANDVAIEPTERRLVDAATN